MSIDDKINQIIQKIYISAADPEAWAQTLQEISQLFQDSHVALNHQNFLQEDLSWTVLHEYDEEIVKQHYEVYNTPDKNPGLKALMTAKELEPFTMSSFLTDEEFHKDPSVNDMLIPRNIYKGLFNVVDKNGSNTSLLLFRGKEYEDYSAREHEILRIIGPHVRNAARLGALNILSQLRHSYSDNLMTNVRYGVLLLSSTAHLFDCDTFAETLIHQSSLMHIKNGRFSIKKTCENTGQDFTDFMKSPDFAFDFIVSETPQKKFIIKKLPSAYVSTNIFIPVPCQAVALRVVDFNTVNVQTAAQIFKLTPAECAVSELVCKGLSQKEICEQLSISPNTLKTHMKRLFEKTDSRRQSELTGKLLKLSG